MSLKIRFAFTASVLGIIVTLPFILMIVTYVNKHNIEVADSKVYAEIDNLCNEMTIKLNAANTLSGSLANTFLSLKKQKKAYPGKMQNILYSQLANNPDLYGTWTVWEPYSVDFPKDSMPIEKFSPYWNKSTGEISLDTLEEYIDPINGRYYLEPKQNRKTVIFPPTEYIINGKPETVSSVVVPIINNNDFQGVVGVDFGYSFFQEILNHFAMISPYTVAVYSDNGKIIAHTDRDKIGKDLEVEKKLLPNSINLYRKAVSEKKNLKHTGFSVKIGEKVNVYLKALNYPNLSGAISIAIIHETDKLYAENKRFNRKIVFFEFMGFMLFFLVMYFYGIFFLRPLNTAINYIMNVADGKTKFNINKTYNRLKDERGLLFNSISYMHNNLIKKEKKRKKENEIAEWIRNGQSRLYDSMQGVFSVKDMAENILSFLCKYLNVQIGALYLYYEKTKYLKLTASYSLTYDDNVENYINIGEGLVGQAALDKKIITLSDVESHYFYSSSSTLKILPKNLIILPFLMNNKVIGVIEFGSYEEITGKKLKLLENVLDNIAIALNSVMITKKILKRRRTKQP